MPNKDSSQRKQSLVLKAGIVTDIDFRDTKPNHIFINSYGAGQLYATLSGIPSPTKYDLFIDSNGEGVYGQDLGVTRVSIFNNGTNDVPIDLTTYEAVFQPSILAKSNVTVSGGSGGTGGAVTIQGFSVPLPSGANHIGVVSVDTMPTQTFTLDTLPAGTNNIGHVNVDTLPALSEGTSNIGKVQVTNGLTIDTMPPMTLNGDVTLADTNFRILSETNFYSHNASIGTSEVVVSLPFAVKTFKFITNDDTTNDVLIAFNAGTTADSQTAQNGVIVLHPGDSLQEFNVTASTIKFKRSAGSGNIRFVGV